MLSFFLPVLFPALSFALSAPDRVQYVDFYGLRSVPRQLVEQVLDRSGDFDTDVDREALCEELRELDGVADAKIIWMMSPGKTIALVGILEDGAPVLDVRDSPGGMQVLPPKLHVAYDGYHEESMNGLKQGVAGSDLAQGHSFSRYAPARAHQETIALFATTHLSLLQETLRFGRDPRERWIAAYALGFYPDKQAIVADLVHAMTDPDSTVRNNATRALGVIAGWSHREGIGIRIDADPGPLVAMLESLEWTDRNKSAALLNALTRSRPERLLAALRKNSLPALKEMSLWHSFGHAAFSLNILARLAGLDEDEIAVQLKVMGTAAYSARAQWVGALAEKAENRTGN